MQTERSLEIVDVRKAFDSVRAVDGISFDGRPGEILGLLGPNGAGKTTTIRMIMGILQPDSGEIRYTFADSTPSNIKERIGYLPEERGLYGDAKVLDLLAYFGELKGLDRVDARSRAKDWIERLDLADWASKKVDKLSKGMQQKVQFAAAVLHRPDLAILDEPFSGLDPVHQDLIKDFIRTLREEKMTVLLSSHQMNLVEELCDRIFLIHRGRRVLYGDLVQVKESFGDHSVGIRFEGDPTVLSSIPGVREFRHEGNTAHFVLDRGSNPDAFVRSVPDAITIRAIHVDHPPLHDIFIRTIEGDTDEAR